jgi:protoporphyrinogen/coproporphyrinogen III oxidase
VLSIDRYPRALPQYAPGHAQRIETLGAATASVPGLFLAGNYLGGVSVGECVRQASEVAATVAEHLN